MSEVVLSNFVITTYESMADFNNDTNVEQNGLNLILGEESDAVVWKQIFNDDNGVTGLGTLTIPSSWNEVLIVCGNRDTVNNIDIRKTMIYPKIMAGTTMNATNQYEANFKVGMDNKTISVVSSNAGKIYKVLWR